MKKRLIYIAFSLLGLVNVSCADYLDIVPDNILTVEQLFNTREGAWQMLHTCYDYMPVHANICENPALLCGDDNVNPVFADVNYHYYRNRTSAYIASGLQSADTPLIDYWDGANYDYLDQRWGDTDDRGDLKSLWAGIRQCNIMIENVMSVPDMKDSEKSQWLAEMQVLKAYYHYYLLQMYGPLPYMSENLSVSLSPTEVQRERETVDVVVSKIVADLDAAIESNALLTNLSSATYDLGRINLPVAKAIKAKVLILAASPLFNGNTRYALFKNSEGEPLFNQEYSAQKWIDAADACIDAIAAAHDAGMGFYEFDADTYNLIVDPRTELELALRSQITENVNNTELVWGVGRQYVKQLIFYAGTPLNSDQGNVTPGSFNNLHGATMNVTDEFYSKNGVPIDEDMTYDYDERYSLITVPEEDQLYFSDEEGIRVPVYNTSREPRFYAYLGFDQGRYFCQEILDDSKSYVIQNKANDFAGISRVMYTPTGYTCKKLIPWKRQHDEGVINNIEDVLYFFPIVRLTDLYLMCAEALNESGASTQEVLAYLQPIRTKAGLDTETGGLVETWAKYSIYPTKPSTQEGMRNIIKQERKVELAFEGQRYWDIRRWNEAELYFNRPLRGWNPSGATDVEYYQMRSIEQRSFASKDYFWPIRQESVDVNYQLDQAPGW